MSLRLFPFVLFAILAGCGSKTAPTPAGADSVATGPAPTPANPDIEPTSSVDAAPPAEDTSPTGEDVAGTVDALALPEEVAAPEKPVRVLTVLAPTGTSPSAIALDFRGQYAAYALIDPATSDSRAVVRVFDLTGPWPGETDAPPPSLATVPDSLLSAELGFAPTRLSIADGGQTLVALGKVTQGGKASSRWHVHAWRSSVEEVDDKPPVTIWTSVFARTFESSQTPILVLNDEATQLYLAGYGASVWALPDLPLEQPVPVEPSPVLSVAAESGWWLPTGGVGEEPPAFRIIDLLYSGETKQFGILGSVFTAAAAVKEGDRDSAKPLPSFSNASVRVAGPLFTAAPVDSKLPPIGWTLLGDELKPLETTFGPGASILAVAPESALLFADGSPRGLYVLPTYQNEIRLPDTFAAATLGAVAPELVLVVLPDGSVHLVPLPENPPEPTWTEATDLSALPRAFLPLFSKEGFALEGRSVQTSYDEEDSGKVTRTTIKGRCNADSVEVYDGLYRAVVSCDLHADYVVDFAGHWYATTDRLWFRTDAASDLVSLLRTPADFGARGGCLATRLGEAHPEVQERCLDAKGPSKTRFEGGPSAYQVGVELRRSR